MTTDQFIDMLHQRKLVPGALAKQLHAKAAQGDDRITPKSILKYLVKKQIITRDQAKDVLNRTLVVSEKAESSILGLSPLADVDDAPAKSPRKAPEKPPAPAAPKREAKAEPKPAKPKEPAAEPTPAPTLPADELDPIDLGPAGTPLLDAGDDDGSFESDLPAEGKPGKGKKKKKKRSAKDRKKGGNEWDSPIILLGGGGLAILVITGVILYWLLFRENADAILKLANEQYEGGSYTQAIANYKKFVEEFPSHKDFSQVKVRLGMTELRKATEGTSDYAGALETAKRVIDDVEDEPAFLSDGDEEGLSQAKREMSTLLTAIAKGLAEQADSAKDPEVVEQRVQQTKETLALLANTKYVPQRLRMENELTAVSETIDRVLARQQRDADLAAAIAEIEKAIAAGDTAAAYSVRRELLKQYPVLMDDPALAAKVLEISAAEKAGVKFVAADQPAQTEPPASNIVAELALADRRGDAAAGVEASAPVIVRVDGAVYALNAADGSVLWRQFVGFDVESIPTTLSDGQVVTADASRGELVCFSADAGKLLWRQPLEGSLAAPVVMGDRLLVASDAGKLFVLDAASGKLTGHVQFSQPLRQPPAVNDRGDRIYVLGEHSSLYTLAADDLACVGVFYLGHTAGGIATPPIALLNKLVVAENAGSTTSRIRALSLNDQGAVAGEAANRRLTGLVVTPLQSSGRRFAAVTTLDQAMIFEVAPGNGADALTVLAARDAQSKQQSARFALLEGSHLWVGGRQLTKMAVLAAGNQLTVQSIDRDYQGDAFDYPLQAAGKLVIHVRRPRAAAGAIVAAMDASANRAKWETSLAVPPAGPPAVDSTGTRIAAGSSVGAVFMLDRDSMARRVQDQAERLPGPPPQPPLTESLDLGQNRLVLAAPQSTAMVHFRPGDPRQPLSAVTLPAPLSAPPVAWQDGFVAATEVGQVFLYNADTAAPIAAPFQPDLTPGKSYRWLRPAVAGEGADARLAISDGVAKLYLVALESQPQPHLAAVASVDVGPSPLVSPLAIVGDRVIAGAESGQLASFTLPDMTPNESADLGGRIVWGPFAAEDGALLALDSGDLVLLGSDAAIRWRRPLEHGELAGAPLVEDGQALLLHPSGALASVNLADGAETALMELGQPVAAGPVAFGQRLLVATPDGTLLVINRP